LDPASIEQLIDKIAQSPELALYQCDSIYTSISLPVSLNLRQLSIWLDLIRKFEFIEAERAPDVPLKEVIKLLVNPRICEATKREWDRDQTGIIVNIVYRYEKDTAEMELLQSVNPELFRKPQKGHKRRKDFMTRNAFEKSFTPTLVDKESFFKHCPCPPESPSDAIALESVTFTGPTVFLAGRYRKMSRELSQTPWVLNGDRKMESSVQELITDVVAPHFKVPADTMLFSSSGREDVDVRCLGRGRPFVLEIQNSFATVLPMGVAAEMEELINRSDKISVTDLQMVKREDLVHIKQGEEKKKKFYRALCYIEHPVTVETLQKLDLPEGFTIQQPTPLRVLHRRPLLTRPRQIFSVKAWADESMQEILKI
jgi:tRNA pseudouridine synthase 10